jgi:hypothetical protein
MTYAMVIEVKVGVWSAKVVLTMRLTMCEVISFKSAYMAAACNEGKLQCQSKECTHVGRQSRATTHRIEELEDTVRGDNDTDRKFNFFLSFWR